MVDPTTQRLLRVAEATVTRRRFLEYTGAAGVLAGVERLLPAWARPAVGPARTRRDVLSSADGPIELTIGRVPVSIGGRRAEATAINGTVPGPLLRFREGDEAVIRVTNELDEDTSIHWHGILLPNAMDGVPKVNFPGIRPGETFTYRYPVRQYGTYWYHSHSGLQEQLGHYGPLIIDPAGGDPHDWDREHIVVLSDWTFEDPYRVLARLKKMPHYYNRRERTVFDFFRDVADRGLGATVRDRLDWGRMRMNPTDVSDVTGAAYTYLVNGLAPDSNWTGLFRPGERVRLRFVNASAATFFDVRIPDLPMTVVQASGQNVRAVETDEFRIGVAETYDVIVEPTEDRAYTVFAEAIDRSGYARGTLAPREGVEAPVPARRERPLLTMADMGMAHRGMPGMGHDGSDGMGHGDGSGPGDGGAGAHGADGMDGHPMAHGDSADVGKGHEAHGAEAMAAVTGRGAGGAEAPRPPGTLPDPTPHGPDGHGPGEAGPPMTTRSRLHEPGIGLGDDGWRVLVYTDLEALEPSREPRPPDREIELHLTGNMERFMWSIDGKTFSEAEPIRVEHGERIRLTMVNDTMMNHPMHLHGMWMELENGRGASMPRVHTINVKPAERVSLLVTADAPGPWAFHCHILYHMEAGMFRVFHVSDPADPEVRG